MWFRGIVAGWDCWLPPSFGSLPAPSGTMEARIRERPYRSAPAQGPLGLVSEVCGIFSNSYLSIIKGYFIVVICLCFGGREYHCITLVALELVI